MAPRTKARQTGAPKPADGTTAGNGPEALNQALRASTKATYKALRELDEDDIPPERVQEYWRNRYLARTSWEHAENAQFAALIDEQKRQLPNLAVASQALADDIAATANAVAVVQVVSAGLGVLARVIALFA